MRKLYLSSNKSIFYLIATRYGGMNKEGSITNLWDYLGCICWGVIKILSIIAVVSYLGSIMVDTMMVAVFNKLYSIGFPHTPSIFFGTLLWAIFIGFFWARLFTWGIIGWWNLIKPEIKEINKTTKEIKKQLSDIKVSFSDNVPPSVSYYILTENKNTFRLDLYENEPFNAKLWLHSDFVWDATNKIIVKNRWGNFTPVYEIRELQRQLLEAPLMSAEEALELALQPIVDEEQAQKLVELTARFVS